MAVQGFLRMIGARRLQRIALHWSNTRAAKRTPAWRDIDAIAIASALPIVWAWRWDPVRLEFIGRLAGEEITAATESLSAMRGRTLTEVFGDQVGRHAHGIFAQLLTTPALFHMKGEVCNARGCRGFGEQVIMPVEDEFGGGVLGATEYMISREPVAAVVKWRRGTKLRTIHEV